MNIMKWSIEDFVYGATDGAVTTFAVVVGVIGSALSHSIILILGFANLFADGFSMAIGNYLSSKSHGEYIMKERRREEWEIENLVEQEKQEIKDIYTKKGFKTELLDEIYLLFKCDHFSKKSMGRYNDERRIRIS